MSLEDRLPSEEFEKLLRESQLTPSQRLALDLHRESESGANRQEVALNIRISQELSKRIDRQAERFGVSRSELVRRVLDVGVYELATTIVTESEDVIHDDRFLDVT